MAFPWAPVISGIGSLGSSIISNIGAKSRQRLADKQNVNFWNMQNQYNLPKNQMQRLKDAGLNPNLIYGSSPAGASGSAGSIAPSKAAPYNIQNPVPPATMLLKPQIDLYNSQKIKNMSDAAYSKSLKGKIDSLIGGEITNLNIKNQADQLRLDIGNSTKQSEINKIVNESNTSAFVNKIKEMESDYANKGLKPDSIGIIMNSLGLSPNNEQDRAIMKGLIYTMYGSQIFKNLSGPIKSVLNAFFN